MTTRLTPQGIVRSRSALRLGTALVGPLAGALVLAVPAIAQNVNGVIVSANSYGINEPIVSGNQTIIPVNAAEAVIEWSTLAGTAGATNVEFLPPTATLSFSLIDIQPVDFTVLNRVYPRFDVGNGNLIDLDATISMAGSVSSSVAEQSGGNIWFYSPNGIITNGLARFDVGSLLLTTSDIDTSNGGSLYLSQIGGKRIGLLPASNPNAFVRIGAGTLINTTSFDFNSAYVGLFAPRIEQAGTINSGAMAALVAAEAGTITFNAGLIDIEVTQGTAESQGNGIVHTGLTGGGPSLDGEARTVAMVAVPKNNALTMLLGGTIGYQAAAVGIPEGSAIVLSAGSSQNLTQASLSNGHASIIGPGNAPSGNIAIGNTVLRTNTHAYATGALDVAPVYAGVNSPGLVDFRQNAFLHAGASASLVAGPGETIRVGDALFVDPLNFLTGPDMIIAVTGDPAGVVDHGLVAVGGLASINAGGIAELTPEPALPTGEDGQGGTIDIAVSRGSFTVGQGLEVFAGGSGADGQLVGGNGTGGTIDLAVADGGTISASSAYLAAFGTGGNAFTTAGGASAGGNGFGGTVRITDNGGSLAFGDVTLEAVASGGSGADRAGSATGGTLDVRIAGQAQGWTSLFGNSTATSGGRQPTTTVMGSATTLPGGARLSVSGGGGLALGSLTLDNNALVNAGSTAAHAASAGGVEISVTGGGRLDVTGELLARANAGLPVDADVGDVVVAPAMTAGSVSIVANGGAISAGSVFGSASAQGIAASINGAAAQGGSVTLGAQGGGSIVLTSTQVPSLLAAEAYGAVGPAAANATGGTVRVYVSDAALSGSAGLLVSASALAGGRNFDLQPVGAGFNAIGGSALVEVQAGSTGTGSIAVGDIAVYAKGEAALALSPFGAGDLAGSSASDMVAIAGNGGTGTGGTARIHVAGGSLTAPALLVRADGIGGSSSARAGSASAFQSGNGIGGAALFTQGGGAVTADSLDLRANGRGGGFLTPAGSGFLAALAGNGRGGTARASLAGGLLDLAGGLFITANGAGGSGMSVADGTGGNGGLADSAAAIAELLMPAGSTARLDAASVAVSARALGGAAGASGSGPAGTGGNAAAGSARYALADGAFAVTGTMSAYADAVGGTGQAGGNAAGGTAAFVLADTIAAPAVTRSVGSIVLNGSAAGGAGASLPGVSTAGASAFAGQAGRAASALVIGGDLVAEALGNVSPAGDGFTGALGAVPVVVQGNLSVTTGRDVSIAAAAGGGFDVSGDLSLSGRAITGGGGGILAADGNVSVHALTSLSLGGVSAGGTTDLRAFNPGTGANGPVSVANLASVGTVTATGSSVTIASPGSLVFGNLVGTSGNVSVTTAGNATFGTVSAAGSLAVQAGGIARFDGASTGSTIAVSSADLQIGTGSLGQRGQTSAITLANAAPAGGTFIGGSAGSGGWRLDAAEALRLFADQSVTVVVGGTAPADVVIGNLGMSFGSVSAGSTPNIGASGTLAVTTPGRIRVTGAARPRVAGTGSTVSLTGGAIDVVTDTGSIVLRDAADALSGTLRLTAPTIRVATGAALADLDALTTLSAVSARLDRNDGVVNDGGALQADTIAVRTGASTFLVQNSGVDTSYASRRGFTARSLSIEGLTGAGSAFAVNGVIVGADGQPVTGLDTQRFISVQGTYDPASTVNGCVFGQDCGIPRGLIAPPRDIIRELVRPVGTGARGLLDLPLVLFGEQPLFDSPPLIDEPVTGVGNDDLWRPRCDAEEDCDR